jgi:MFS family permease
MSAHAASIETRVPARLDRLPWSRFHWLVVIGLGTVWILDGLEVTIVGSVASRMTESGSGISVTSADIGTAAAVYVAGACTGALFFGQLTDRFGRKRLFLITLALYIAATSATAFSFSAWYLFVARFFTGAGIGGEYAAINSAIDELIPARVRGRVDLIINGSYWVGSAAGSALAILLLDETLLPKDIGWRVAFAIGAVLGVTIMLVRRNVPESPRWLFIHGREDEAERIVDRIEQEVEDETGRKLPEPDESLEVRQRERIPFRTIAATAFKVYPTRSVLGLALFVGQAFLYNGVTFNLGTLYTTFYKVSSGFVPVFIIVFAAGNFLGPLLLGRLFDTVGRKPMITATYLGSAAVAIVMAPLFTGDALGSPWALEAFIFGTFFLASAGASSAYLTVSEIFPMETRALAIAFFYAIGTAVGGISGPLLFGSLINSGSRSDVAIAFYIGAAVMALGGIAEVFFGVKAEGQELESIAKPLTVEEAEEGASAEGAEGGPDLHPEHREALRCRERAEEERARAAEHRALAHELEARDREDSGRAQTERVLAELAELAARAHDEQANAHDEREAAERAEDDDEREAAEARARAAEERARVYEEHARAISSEHEADAERHAALAESAAERARAREQRGHAAEARAAARDAQGEPADEAHARAEVHERWAATHDERAAVHEARAERDRDARRKHEAEATRRERLSLAAEERLEAAGHRVSAGELRDEEQKKQGIAERERRRQERERRIRERLERRRQRERSGLRRFRPGPGRTLYSPGMVGTAGSERRVAERALDEEIDVLERALEEHGETDARELSRLVGARYWGPGRFRRALREATGEGRVRRVSRTTYAPPDRDGGGNGAG